ncbi:DoxX family protein [Fulvivirgaceae bacterium PWU37]|uniref:DoxX family protein n=1 Tax=Dawidia soli TaxID=2782352 RepID=A0AAP2GBD6_9BACT|nr:DoxX family protein [Dawidia soli]
MKPAGEHDQAPAWKGWEKTAFRFFFVYFLIQIVPLDWKYYRDLFEPDGAFLSLRDIFYAARYTPRFFGDVPVFADWGIAAALAAAATALWGYWDRERKEYTNLYYALRVILRYRLAFALLAYALIKFYPQQMPLPSVGNLNTHYGDISAWKLFSMSTGIVPGYQSFLGLVEAAAALLLVYRKTASIGAFIVLPFTGNVLMSNLAYEGGEYVYSLLLITFAAFVLAYDVPRLLRLTSFELPTEPNRYQPVCKADWQRYGRWSLKLLFVALVGWYGYQSLQTYRQGGYQFPHAPGLANAAGLYDVHTFRVNGRTISPGATDAQRWRDVAFEKWATLSIRTNQPAPLVMAGTEELFANDDDRNYEYAGTTGRHYLRYDADTINRVLTFRERDSKLLTLHYTRPDTQTITLAGVTAAKDSVYVELRRIDKRYLLDEAAKVGRRRGLKL